MSDTILILLAIGTIMLLLAGIGAVHAEETGANLSVSCQVIRPDQPMKQIITYNVVYNANNSKGAESKTIEYYY